MVQAAPRPRVCIFRRPPRSAEREEELLALALAEALEDGVVDGGDVDAALLARGERLVEEREHVAVVVDAGGQHPAQHRAVELQLLEAAAAVRRQARLPAAGGASGG